MAAPRYLWEEGTGRYRSARTGRFVSPKTVRTALDQTLARASSPAGRVSTLSKSLQSGEINVADWQRGMMREVKSIHLNSATSARGGWSSMSQADYGRAGQRIRYHYGRLNRFAEQIASGEVPLDGRFLQRSQMYVEAGRSTYERTADADQTARGFTEIRNILRDVRRACESGDRIGCVELTSIGWMPINDPRWVVPGERTCLSNCRCGTERRNPDTGETR